MKLTPAAFSTKWKQRFLPNDEFKVTAGDLQEQAQDIADSFGVSVANVPAYVAGSTYTVGYLVRYGSAQGRESFYYALKAGLLPAPTYQVSDANWKLVPGPVAPTVFTQEITLLEAGGIEGDAVAVRLYAITGAPIPNVSNPNDGCWNQDGQTRTIYVWGYPQWWGKLGVLLDSDGRPQEEVEVNVAAGTYQTRIIGGGPGGSYTDQQAQQAARQLLLDSAQTGVSVTSDPQTGRLALTNTAAGLGRLYFNHPRPGTGNLLRCVFQIDPVEVGAYAWKRDMNVSRVELGAVNTQPASYTIEQVRQLAALGSLFSGQDYYLLLTPTDVNQPSFLELKLL